LNTIKHRRQKLQPTGKGKVFCSQELIMPEMFSNKTSQSEASNFLEIKGITKYLTGDLPSFIPKHSSNISLLLSETPEH
jgi:hypothetical protein